jgi:hypothetical protein
MTGIFNMLVGLGGGSAQLFVEDVFSTYLYTGNGSTQTITNGINLPGEGGLVWAKSRVAANSHILTDTARGVANTLATNFDGAQNALETNALSSFNSNGFTLNNSVRINASGEANVSWTFRKAPNFFDVVTYTGNGGTQNIAHSLGVAPGMIIVKNTTSNTIWSVWHRSVNGGSAYAVLNLTDAFYTSFTEVVWGNNTTYVAPTTTQFTVGQSTRVNQSGNTFVAYLFAHVTGSDGIIQCGTFNNSGGLVTVTLGWEPQWILMKNAAGTGDWFMVDNMRGMPVGGSDPYLYANSAASENSGDIVTPTATGFVTVGLPGSTNFIYMAIRRGPMKTPTLGTSVFSPVANSSAIDASTPVSLVPPASDLWLSSNLSGAAPYWQTRLTGWNYLRSSNTSTENTSYTWTQRTQSDLLPSGGWWSAGTSQVNYFFKRAPGFFDVVCYTGTGVARTITHNLGVAPELIIVKARTNGGTIAPDWTARVPALGATSTVFLNLTGAAVDYQSYVWNNSNPTSTGVDLSADNYLTNSATGSTYVMYLFASVPGVSKVGTYTGNGSSQTINCAFTTGARFVMIKRTDSTGDWYVWDSARGIVAGNDPYLALNSTAAEVTSNDSVDTDNTGFIVNQVAASNVNVSSATYIFLAIA